MKALLSPLDGGVFGLVGRKASERTGRALGYGPGTDRGRNLFWQAQCDCLQAALLGRGEVEATRA
jgi:hypothetical protein